MMKTLAFFGGSFNPPHIAHVLASTFVLAMEEVDELWIVPCFRHPFSKSLAPFEDRLAMCRMAFSWLPRVRVSTIERELGGESRTIRTIRHLRGELPDWRLRLVIGTDIMSEAPRWSAFDELRQLAPPIVLARRGWEAEGASERVFPEISSTQIREALGRGDEAFAASWLTPPVLRHALERDLYGPQSDPKGGTAGA